MGARCVFFVRSQLESYAERLQQELSPCCRDTAFSLFELQKATRRWCSYWNLQCVSDLYRVNFNMEKPRPCDSDAHGFNAVLTHHLLRSVINRVQAN
jgi:hypothetical protein